MGLGEERRRGGTKEGRGKGDKKKGRERKGGEEGRGMNPHRAIISFPT